jgi:signal transduction histidine kinase
MSSVVEHFPSLIAQRLRAEQTELAGRWLSRLSAILPVEVEKVFPTDHLLDHIPELIVEIAEYLECPERQEIAANAQVITKTRELGLLRYTQHASVHQIMREYRVFEGVLSTFIKEELGRTHPYASQEVVDLLARVHHAISVLQQSTMEAFIEQYSDTVHNQTVQLQAFNRMVSHELRQPLGTLQFALRLLQASDTESAQDRLRLIELLDRNVQRSLELTNQLTRLSGLHAADDDLQVQRVKVETIAQEAARQLRDMADSRGVSVQISDALPEIVVDVAALELVLVNLISNAIKYSDPKKADRFVEITAAMPLANECVIEVRDNGLGIPSSKTHSIFDQYVRAHAAQDGELRNDGLGLGLTIVKDCIRTLGGQIDVQSSEGSGTVFIIRFPTE